MLDDAYKLMGTARFNELGVLFDKIVNAETGAGSYDQTGNPVQIKNPVTGGGFAPRQTVVCSATLSLPVEAKKRLQNKKNGKSASKITTANTTQEAIFESFINAVPIARRRSLVLVEVGEVTAMLAPNLSDGRVLTTNEDRNVCYIGHF